jgi:hypothetical protein
LKIKFSYKDLYYQNLSTCKAQPLAEAIAWAVNKVFSHSIERVITFKSVIDAALYSAWGPHV